MAFDILLTGGLGFQGSHLVRALLEGGFSVNVIARNSEHAAHNLATMLNGAENLCNLRITWGDVLYSEMIRAAARQCKCIIHLAAQVNVDESIRFPERAFYGNFQGTFNVLEASRNNGSIPVIYASSCEVYGSNTTDKPMTEDHPMKPQSPYAASKAAADRLAYSYGLTYQIPVTIMRPGNVYGYGQKAGVNGAVIAKWINGALRGDTLKIYGDGSQGRDWVYVSDVANGYMQVVKRLFAGQVDAVAGQVFNLGTGINTPILEIAQAISATTGIPHEFVDSRPGEVQSFALDSANARDKLGWVPFVGIQHGIGLTIDEARKHGGF